MQAFQRGKITYLVRIADQFWASARLAWILGGMHPAMENLNTAVELYMRAAWLSGQSFKDEKEMSKALRLFHKSEDGKSHDYATMLTKLPSPIKDAMKEAKVQGFTLASHAVAKYGDGPGMGYGEGMFNEVDRFIKVIRTQLGFPNPKNHYEIIAGNLRILYPRDQVKIEAGLKAIVGASKILTQKERDKRLRDIIQKALSEESKAA